MRISHLYSDKRPYYNDSRRLIYRGGSGKGGEAAEPAEHKPEYDYYLAQRDVLLKGEHGSVPGDSALSKYVSGVERG